MEQKVTQLKVIRILYFALLIGMLMFAGISFFISQISEPSITDKEVQRNFLIASLFISVVCITISGNLLKKDLSQIKEMSNLTEKLESYRAAAIRSYALTEGAALFAIIIFFLTHKIQILAVAGLLVFAYLMQYPTANKVASQIGANAEDVKAL